MMDSARTSAADLADRGPDEVRAQRFGVRESDRLIEDWITSRIERVSHRSGKVSGIRHMSIGPSLRLAQKQASPDTLHSARQQGWKRLRIDHRGDVTVVHLLDQHLIHEGPLAELRGELRDLTTAGCARIVLNLARVEQVSSQFLEILTTLDRLSSNRPGGRLKLCKVGSEVSRIIALCGLEKHFEITPDLPTALEGPWPADGCPVPIELLEFLTERSEVPRNDKELEPLPQPFLTVRRDGKVLGTLRIPEIGLRIGRDTPCELRLRHQSVSRVHAWIGRRNGHVCLEDLASSNGTAIGTQLLRSTSVTLKSGDLFSIGPYHLELSGTGAPVAGEQPPNVNEQRRCFPEPWSRESLGNTEEIEGPSSDLEAQPPACVRIEQIDDVLVLSPTISQIDQDDTIDALRETLDRLIRHPNAIVNVVINLAPVAFLSGRVIGLMMAHHLKLRRLGGSLRLAQASPSVMVAFDVVGLQTVIETFPILDDAVLTRWPK